jgi:ribosomal protein S18 acetylase RimI-like enzyme
MASRIAVINFQIVTSSNSQINSMLTIKKVDITEADILLDYSKKTFYDFFAHLNDPANMEAYSAVTFTRQNMLDQLTNPNSHFYFATLGDEIAGYIKLNFGDAQTDLKDNNALEIERIYVSAEHHGKKIGKQLLTFAIETAMDKNFDYVWLGVWEHNHNALGFYEHNGFEVFSRHEFLLGNDRQTDLLMKKEL